MTHVPQAPTEVGQRLFQATQQNNLGPMAEVLPFPTGPAPIVQFILGPIMFLIGLLLIWSGATQPMTGFSAFGLCAFGVIVMLLSVGGVAGGVLLQKRGAGWVGLAPGGAVVTHEKDPKLWVFPYASTTIRRSAGTARRLPIVYRLNATFTGPDRRSLRMSTSKRSQEALFNHILTRFPGQLPMSF